MRGSRSAAAVVSPTAVLAMVLVLAACSGGPDAGPTTSAAAVEDGASLDGAAQAPEDASAATADGAGGAGDTGEVPPTSADACSLLTEEEVASLVNGPARVDTEGPAVVAGTDCVWVSDEAGLHQVHLQTFTAASFYSPQAWGGTPQAIEGIGDEAFLIPGGPLGATAGYRSGERVVLLNYQILLGGAGHTPGDRTDQLTALLTTITTRFVD